MSNSKEQVYSSFYASSIDMDKIFPCKIEDFSDKVLEEFKVTEEVPFPCYSCPNIGQNTPRCDGYKACCSWLTWAYEHGLRNF